MKSPNHLDLIVPTIKALKEMGGTATPAEIAYDFDLNNKSIQYKTDLGVDGILTCK